MRILVCFKTVYDLEYITPQELVSLQDGSLDLSVFKKKIGSYDEAALETALRLAEHMRRQAGTVNIHGLTAGECEKRIFGNLFPLGFDDLIHIPLDTNFPWSPELVAAGIAAFVKDQGGYDVIITGKQTGPGETGLIPYMLASRLGYPCVSEVFSLERCGRGVKVTSKTDTGQKTMTVTKPAVYAVGEAMHPYLRVATLREKIAAGSMEARTWSVAGAGPVPGSARFLQYEYTMPQRQYRIIEGKNLGEKMETLWAYLQKASNA